MENYPDALRKKTDTTCPFMPDEGYIPSTNTDHRDHMKMNRINPAANTWDVTHPSKGRNVENFQPWLAPDNELAKSVANRKRIYYADPERTCKTQNDDPSIRNAAQQLLEIQADYLCSIYPEIYSIHNGYITNHASQDTYPLQPTEKDLHPMAICGLLGQEDLCIVERQSDNRYVLVAGFLASPTNWNLSMFMGADMDGIHAEVHNYPQRLKRVVDAMLNDLSEYPDGIKARNNMFLKLDGSQSLIPDVNPEISQSTIEDPGKQIYFRSERETLTRLPSTAAYPDNNRYIVFSIKPHVFQLEEIKKARGNKLIEVVKTNSKLQSYPFLKIVEDYLNDPSTP